MKEGEETAPELCESPSIVSTFPTEVLLNIFEHLPGRQLYQCRRVCVRWKEIIDDLDNPQYWRMKCQREHSSVYKAARSKSHPSLPWRSLYKSLCLWSNVESAKENWRVIVDCPIDGKDIHTVHAWRGTAAAHKRDSITYFDVETLKQTNNINIGRYLIFEENEDVIVYMYYMDLGMSWFRQLRIVPKVNGKPQFKNTVKVENVNNFILFNEDVYYNQWRIDPNEEWSVSEMCVCKLKDNYKCVFIDRLFDNAWGMGGTGSTLHFLTGGERIYSLVDDKFTLSDIIEDEKQKIRFSKLCKYNLAERANFPDVVRGCGGIFDRRDIIPDCTLRVYGDVVLTGSSAGILRIYHGPTLYMDQNTAPIKEYDLKSQFTLSEPKIKGIDVLEKENGHVVVVCTLDKMVALSLSHD